MQSVYEISDRYIEPGNADGLLYEPVEGGLTYRKTRRYEIEYSGDEAAMAEFVRTTLFDEVSQEFHEGDEPALEGAAFILDYGMKPGALDLEKEAVVNFYKGMSDPGFTLENLTIRQRIYVFGGGADQSDRFVRDICNAAVHNWNVIHV